ncbi:hypothetical protein RF11_15663 [Thelohanellus kitauei]|uniref:Uncharacterized protein n=1 Tax=Thelohanellus kitauei TaxID=669202 RepID=A0A0C2MRM7_THEKT|nr:hypothetical protein RF11_15663 [Thelohanellus kitauei]
MGELSEDFIWKIFTITDPWEKKGCQNVNHKELLSGIPDDTIGYGISPHIITAIEEMNWDDVLSKYAQYKKLFKALKVFFTLLRNELPNMVGHGDVSITKIERKHLDKIIKKLINISSCFECSKRSLKKCVCKSGIVYDQNIRQKLCQTETVS